MEKVSIIVLNYNGLTALGSRLLSICLKSVLETNYEDLVVLFVDNASNDSTVEFVKKEFRKYIKKGLLYILQLNRNYGWSGGNNRGAIYALKRFNPDYIIFLNNDIYVASRYWLKALVRIMEKYNVHVASPLVYEIKRQKYSIGNIVLNDGRSIPIEFTEADLQRMSLKNIQVLRVPAVHGAAMIVRSKIFRALRGFDEGFKAYYDETDCCFRARSKGYQVAATIDPDTKILHFGSVTIEKQKNIYNKKVMYVVESSLRFTYKHYGLKSLLLCTVSTMRWLFAEAYRLNSSNMLGIAFGLINSVRRSLHNSRRL